MCAQCSSLHGPCILLLDRSALCQGLSHLDLELFLLDGILSLDSEIFLGILSRTVIFQLEISSLLLLDQELLLQHYLLELSALVLDLDLELIEFIV